MGRTEEPHFKIHMERSYKTGNLCSRSELTFCLFKIGSGQCRCVGRRALLGVGEEVGPGGLSEAYFSFYMMPPQVPMCWCVLPQKATSPVTAVSLLP